MPRDKPGMLHKVIVRRLKGIVMGQRSELVGGWRVYSIGDWSVVNELVLSLSETANS